MMNAAIRISRHLIHIGVVVIALAMAISYACSREGSLYLRFDSGQARTWREDGDRIVRLPFAAGISRIDNGKAIGYRLDISYNGASRVYMIKPGSSARHDGYRFLPVAEDDDGNGIWLQVTHDKAGEPLAYAGFLILLSGMSVGIALRIRLLPATPLARRIDTCGKSGIRLAEICVMTADIAYLAYRALTEAVFPAVSISDTLALTSLAAVSLTVLPGIWSREIRYGGLAISLLTIAGGIATMTSNSGHPATLEHPLLSIHVCLIMSSYAIFGTLAASAIAILIKKTSSPDIKKLIMSQRALIYIAETLLTAGIATGSVWGADAWGKYWNWDVKEIWALTVMLIYIMPFHTRWFPMLKKPVYFELFLIAGLASILFTWFGVTRFFGGLHAY